MSEQKKSYSHVIREKWCKGCGICVAFCPKKVLALKNGKVVAERPEDCIGCRMCEYRCPDLAIEIRSVDTQDSAGSELVDPALPPEAHHA